MDYPYYAGEPRQWVTEMRREYYPIVSISTEFDARENRGARTKFWVRIEGGTDRWLLKIPRPNTGEPLDRIGSVPEDEALPARTGDWMAENALSVVEPQQCVDDAAVANVDLGRLCQSLADVGVERRQSAHQQEIHKQVDIPRYRLAVYGEASGQRSSVPETSLGVREHGPEPAQRVGRDPRGMSRSR